MSDKFLPKEAVRRLQKEYKTILKEPPANIHAHPSPNNILEWHYVLEGTGDYEGGFYHGKVIFPPTYPYKPPSIKMITPNGRFATNTRLCLSMSDFHPETWNPMWSVASILTGLLSFMHDDQPTAGSVKTSRGEKRRLAKESLEYNLKNPTFRKLFPEMETRLQQLQAANRHSADNGDASVGGEQDEREKGVTDKEGSTATGPPEALPSHVFWMAVFAAAAAAVIAIPLMSLWKE